MKKLVVGALFIASVIFSLAPLNSALAAILEPGFEVETIAGGFTLPTAMAFSDDGRIFVAEKGGSVRVVESGNLLPTPVITLTDINTFGDRGLIGIATDPNFTSNGYLYLSYTYENSPGASVGGMKTGRIVRVTVVNNVASESSKVVLVGTVGGNSATPSCDDFAVTADCIPSDSLSHSVGGLRFGPDGKLYATTGDGANFDFADPKSLRAQNIDSLAGKVLRLNPDGSAPADNPFYNGDPNSNRSKVYALGVRNAFRLNFHPTTGALFAGDVGWSDWEEINRVTPGANFGWPCIEGTANTSHACSPSSAATAPTYAYAHDGSGAGSVVAGDFPSNGAYPTEYDSSLFIGDYAQNWIKRLEINASNVVVAVHDFDDSPDGPVDITTGPDGTVYYLAIYTGELRRLTHTDGNRHPIPVIDANPDSGLAPLTVNFSSAGSNDPDGDAFDYDWNFGDGATSADANPVHQYTTNGTYNVVLTLTDVHGSSASENLSVTVGNQAPTANIITPASGALYVPNQNVQLNGTGVDPEDGALPATAFHWEIILHHNVHTHVIQTFYDVINPIFIGPDHGDPDVYTEIILTVTDSNGLVGTRSINMYLNNGSSSGNLIGNPSFEIADETSGQPIGWFGGWFGDLDVVFNYPVAGFEGADAARVTLSRWVDGNAKWYFDPAFVTPGETYLFSDHYTSNVQTRLVVQFSLDNGTYQYLDLGALPPTATPTQVDREIIVPAGVETLTVFHEIAAVGTLTVDDYSLTLVDDSAPTNLIMNGDMETANGANPLGWAPGGWGNHTRVFTYPVTGYDGGPAVRSEITAYPPLPTGTGDSKWAFTPVAVSPGTEYTYSDHYRSNTISDIIGQYTMSDGSFHYFGLAKEIQPTTTWQTISGTFVPPVGATHVTLFHLISAVGYVEIADAEMFVSGSGTPSETNPPVVTFTNPLEGQTVSGTVNLTATSTDDTAVTYIFYAVDGIPITGQITTAPYLFAWDSTTVSDGPHLLKATTHDPFGNNSTHTISFNVNNSVPPVSNLILNPSLETPGTGGNPANWLRGGWGTNNRAYTYPTAGIAGASAAKVEITSYTNGDAKWYFAEVPVTPGTTYTLSHKYKSTATTEILVRYTLSGGGVQYLFLGAPTAAAGWTSSTFNIVPPTNAVSLTLFHLVRSVGSLEVDDFSLSTATADTVAPTASITAPTASATVSGSVNVTANANDNVGVAGVTLLIDDVVVGAEDVTAPYAFTWDTTSLSNGVHNLKVRARDAAGNTFTTPAVAVTVSNTVSSNLILNPSLETPGTGGDPANWARGGWGTNNRVFTYPVAGSAGAAAARVAITSYTNGDAKWYFNEVPVTGGQTFTFTDHYRSDVSSNITIRYRLTSGGFQYVSLGNFGAKANWTEVNQTFVAPANATHLTVMHILYSVGFLEVDDYSLVTGSGDTFANGMISLTFDDGWLSHYTAALPILEAENMDGTFYIVSQETLGAVPTERISNPSLETAGTGGDPADWFRGGWGTNNRTFTYPVAGVAGASAAKVEITSYTNGDAKWYFGEATVVPGQDYIVSDSYNSTVASEVLMRYKLTNGSTQYAFLASLPSTGGTWQNFQQTIILPANVASVTMFHLISGVGSLTVDNYSLKQVQDYVSASQMLALQTAGHEIGAHSRTHPSLTSLTLPAAEIEIEGSMSDIQGMGANAVTSLAYPFGDYNSDVQDLAQAAGLTSARSVDRGYNTKNTDKFALKIQQVGRTTTLADIQTWTAQAAADNTWLILMFHQIDYDPAQTLGITPEFLQQIVDQVASTDLDVVTVSEGVALMNP